MLADTKFFLVLVRAFSAFFLVAIAFAGISFVSLMMIFVIQGTIVNWELKHILIFGGYVLIVFGTLFAVTKLSKPALKEDEEGPSKPE